MVSVHVARVGLFTTDESGQRIDKNSPNTTINQLKRTGQSALIIPDATIPNTSGYPNIKSYLEAEASDGYVLNHLDQTFCITYSIT